MDYNYDRMKENGIRVLMDGEEIDRCIASFEHDFTISVCSNSFASYLGICRKQPINILCMIHPDDVETFKSYVTTGYRQNKEITIAINVGGLYHTNIVRHRAEDVRSDGHISVSFEFIDVYRALDMYEKALMDMTKSRVLFNLNEELLFTYSKYSNKIRIYGFDELRRVDLYNMDVDEWKRMNINEGKVVDEDKAMFETFILDLKSYIQTFTVRFTSSIFSQSGVVQCNKIVGTVYKENDGNNVVIGRILKDSKNQGGVNAELIGQLNIDSLTEVLNKKAITDYAKNALATQKDKKVIITILDLDHFKSVNDTFGHLCGDKVLSRAARRLKEIVGSDGVVGRIGGDEFMIVFTEIEDDQSLRAMLRALRTQIKWEFAEDFEGISITTSIGAAIFPTNGTEYEDLFRKADCCLYIAKEKGRDRYVYFRDELHRSEYESTLNNNEIRAINNNRDMRELQYVSRFMRMTMDNPVEALRDAMFHMVNNFGVDNISVYYGEGMKRVFSWGVSVRHSEDAAYVDSREFVKYARAMGGRIVEGFVRHRLEEYPEFCQAMSVRGVTSTIQCVIGSDNDIRGLIAFNKVRDESQWANYEADCASVIAAYIGLLCENDNIEVLKKLTETEELL